MAYTKTIWKDRSVEKPMTYTLVTNADGTTTLNPAEGGIIESGTPINASTMNNLESQYDSAIAEALLKTGGALTGAITSNSDITTATIITGNEVKATTFVSEGGVHLEDKYLKLAGGTITGPVTFTDPSVKLTGTNSGLEVGATGVANSPFIDFHSSGNAIDYDARIVGSGGSATVGAGSLDFKASLLSQNGKELASIDSYGSNTNGTFIRYTNGLQMCYIAIQPTDQAISGAYGSLFQGTRAWTFPATFLTGTTPVAQCSEFKWGTGAGWGAISGASTPTTATLRGFDVSTRATGTVCYISAFAIGKWK